MRCVTGFRQGQSMAPYLNLHEWKWRHKALSQQATHSASGVCLACVALSCIPQWASLCGAGARHPPLQTPVLDILDSPSCDIFLLWTRWCHFLLGQMPVQINPGMWRGARGAIFWGHAADKFTRSCSSDMSQSRQQARYSLKWQLSSHLAHLAQLCPIVLHNQPHPHHPTPLRYAGKVHFLVRCAHLRPRLCNEGGIITLSQMLYNAAGKKMFQDIQDCESYSIAPICGTPVDKIISSNWKSKAQTAKYSFTFFSLS